GTLNAALTNFAAAWATLAATPSSVALRSTVVNDGVAFANLARNQFTQLVTLQTGMNDQINQTVTNINQLLQQLSSLNKQLLGSQGANVNDLLDARDYALDKLSRLINIQSNFGTAGTVNVFLGSSSLSLVDSAGAAILQTNDLNPHNPGLVNINIQDSEGSVIPQDATSLITGGNLAGELQARDVILENYKTQLDQVATSVMNVTNIFHQAGYAADGNTTNTAFFTGTTAQDINVNEALVSDPTRALLAASSRQGFVLTTESTSPINSLPTVPINPAYSILSQLGNFAIPPTGGSFTVNGVTINYTTGSTINGIVGQINGSVPGVTASFNVATQEFNFSSVNPVTIGEIGGDNFVLWASIGTVSTQNGQIAQFLGNLPNLLANNYMESQPSISGAPINPNLAISTQAPLLATAPSAAGIFNLNMTTVSWTNADSIYTILDKINAADPNVQAVYNYTQKAFYLLSNNPVNVSDISGNFTAWANTQDVLVSSVRMNNGFTLAPKIPQIITAPQLLNSANNTMAFRVTPGTSGTFVLNGVTINWTNTQTFNSIRAAIGGIPGMGASFSNAAQTFTLFNKTPIQIIDTSGNFTVFTGLNGNTPIGNLASGILTQI
ncbi:MAG TPA: flagellin hook IN motif-containing protein, partial [bacterium]